RHQARMVAGAGTDAGSTRARKSLPAPVVRKSSVIVPRSPWPGLHHRRRRPLVAGAVDGGQPVAEEQTGAEPAVGVLQVADRLLGDLAEVAAGILPVDEVAHGVGV